MQRRTGIWFSDPKPRGKKWGVLRRGGPDDPPAGRWFTFATEKEAQGHKRASERHLARHRTFDEAAKEYVAWTKATKRPAAKYVLSIQQHLSYIFPDPAASLTELGAKHYKKMAESGRYAVATHQVALRIARAFLEWCCDPDRAYLKENPLAKVKAIGKANKRRHQLRRDELEPWIAVAYDRAERGNVPSLAALALYYLGARPSEVLGLKARDLDDGGKLLVISVSNDEDSLKTEDSHRVMDLDDPGLDDIRELLVRAKRDKLPWRRSSTAPIAASPMPFTGSANSPGCPVSALTAFGDSMGPWRLRRERAPRRLRGHWGTPPRSCGRTISSRGQRGLAYRKGRFDL